ncbi:MAG: type II toxin-antitoxin system VapC family toxin [Candidatus Cloacimonetes bacterium]|nr:type II toxin-antitoxin system VapC family toxin [Candidatus Cloacimonadota bacterium]
MNYLIDTQVLIWFLNGNVLLRDRIRKIIENLHNNRFVSIASLWEIAIKMNIGKLDLDYDFEQMFLQIEHHSFEILPIKPKHLHYHRNLEILHKDPFDRLLISTAITENMKLITSDENIHKYPVDWVW